MINNKCFLKLNRIVEPARGLRLLHLVVCLVILSAAGPLYADITPETQASQEFSKNLSLGYRYADSEDDRTFLAPYDPLESGPVLSFDLFYLRPHRGTFILKSIYQHEDSWDVGADYNYGANVAVGARAREFYHALEHRSLSPADPGETFPDDQDAGGEYFSNFRESRAHFKVRAPAYPAHFRASGRIYTRQGPSQMIYLDENCATNCHVVSKRRDLDQETREYVLGIDSHLGPIDVAYNRNMMTFEDQAPDPKDAYGTHFRPFRRPGLYLHDANPDLRAFTDTLKVNTNLTNRAAVSFRYSRGESENENSDITRRHQRLAGNLNYTLNSRLFLVLRYRYDQEETKDISDASLTIRQEIETAEKPGRTENSGEAVLRYRPRSGLQLRAHLRHSSLTREETEITGQPERTRSTMAEISGDYHISPTLELTASIGNEWTDDPAFTTDSTSLLRFSLGTNWNPCPFFSLQAFYNGYRGENDDSDALQSSYHELPEGIYDLKRKTDGDSLTAIATLNPREDLSLTAAYSITDNDIKQDLIFGSPGDAVFSFLSANTPWESRSQVTDLKARWTASELLVLTAGGMLISGEEKYRPEFAKSAGLSEIAAVEFLKLLASLKAEFNFTETMGLSLTGLWVDFNDKENNDRDGNATSVVATISKRW